MPIETKDLVLYESEASSSTAPRPWPGRACGWRSRRCCASAVPRRGRARNSAPVDRQRVADVVQAQRVRRMTEDQRKDVAGARERAGVDAVLARQHGYHVPRNQVAHLPEYGMPSLWPRTICHHERGPFAWDVCSFAPGEPRANGLPVSTFSAASGQSYGMLVARTIPTSM